MSALKTLAKISDRLLDESSEQRDLQRALDDFVALCSNITGITPDASFDAWAGDAILPDGVAINPRAAAHCVTDYRRSVVFIRGVYAAILSARTRFPHTPIEILYAGCGPFATLLLPLMAKFKAGELSIHLLDIHQQSLDSVDRLLRALDLTAHEVSSVQADACTYRHTGKLHLIIAETMQKSLEQEPQFAVTANLAPQLHPQGIFIPQIIEVELCLAHLEQDQANHRQSPELKRAGLPSPGQRHPLATVMTLSPQQAIRLLRASSHDPGGEKPCLHLATVEIPAVADIESFDALLFTRIQVFSGYRLQDYEAEITLPLHCHELSPLQAGAAYHVSYELGSYPRFCLTPVREPSAHGPGEGH